MSPKEKHSTIKKLTEIHDALNESPAAIADVKKQIRKLANELDAYQASFGESECDTGDTIP